MGHEQDPAVPDLATELELGTDGLGVEPVDSKPEWGFGEEYKVLLSDPRLRKIAFSIAIISGGVIGYKALETYLAERSIGGLGETDEVISDLEATGEEMSGLSQEDRLTVFLEYIRAAGRSLRETAQQQDPENEAAADADDAVASFTDQTIGFLEAALDAEITNPEERKPIIASIEYTCSQVVGLLKNIIDGEKVHKDTRLVLSAIFHQPQAFAKLYEKYRLRIYNYLDRRLSIVPDRNDVLNDLTSDVFAKAYAAITQGKFKLTGAPFTSFLYRIAYNHLLNWRRDIEGRTIAVGLISHHRNYGTELIEGQYFSSPNEPEIAVLKASEMEPLNQAIAQLNPDRQLLLELKLEVGLTNQQIGEIMGKSEGAIKSLYHRTLAQLREALDMDR